MKTKLFLALTFLTFSLFAFAVDNTTEGQIRASVFEMESQISKSIEAKVMQFVGSDKIWVSAHIAVSIDELEAHLAREAKKDDKPQPKKYSELPGLAVSENGAVVNNEKEAIIINNTPAMIVDKSLILSYAKDVKVTVYHKVALERKVERVIRTLIEEKLASLKMNVEVKFDQRKARALDQTDFSEVQKVQFDPNSFAKSFHEGVALSFQNFLNENVISPLKTGALVTFAIGTLVMGLAFFFLGRTLLTINQTLSAVGRNLSSNAPEASQSRKQIDEVAAKPASTNVSVNGEEDVNGRILEIHENYREIITNFFLDAMDKRSYQDIWALSQILGEKLLVENEALKVHKNYRDYNAFLRENLFDVGSVADAKKIYQKLMGLMLYPDVFFLNSIRSQLTTLKQDKLAALFSASTKQEKGALSELVDSFKLAALINDGTVKPEEIAHDEGQQDLGFLRKLDQKVAQFIGKNGTEKNRILDVLMRLNQFQFDSFLKNQNVPDRFYFENLYEAKRTEADELFQGLSVEELAGLLPMLSTDMEENILKLLPEIKLARVMQNRKAAGVQGQQVMVRVYELLLEDCQEELALILSGNAKSQPALKAVA